MKKGVPISPGVAVARAFRLDEVRGRRGSGRAHDPEGEVVRASSGPAMRPRTNSTPSSPASAARSARTPRRSSVRTACCSRDPALVGKVKSSIRNRRVDAGTALHDALDEYAALFARIPDEYLASAWPTCATSSAGSSTS